MSFHERLKEERERLGYTQPAFAALAGATKQAQLKWEKGETSPNAAALSAWALAGLNLLYVFMGVRAEIHDHLGRIRTVAELAKGINGTDLEKAEIATSLYAQLVNPAPTADEIKAMNDAFADAVPVLRNAAMAVLNSDPNGGVIRRSEDIKARVREKLKTQ